MPTPAHFLHRQPRVGKHRFLAGSTFFGKALKILETNADKTLERGTYHEKYWFCFLP